MAVIKGGFEIVKRAMLKELMKRGDDGIMLTLPKNEILDLNTRITMDRLIRNGIDPDSLTSPDQVLNVLENINNQIIKNATVLSGDDAAKFLNKAFPKKGDVVDMTGKKIDTSQGIMGGKSVKELMESGQVQKGTDDIKISEKITDREMFKNSNLNKKDSVTETISYIKTLEPMDAMKEANLVIGRKDKYKNLTPEESKKILKDTEDHIFERDIPDEDFAKGGRAGFRGGGRYQGGSSSGSRSSTNQGPAGGASAGGNYGGNRNPEQTYGGVNNNTVGGGGGPTTTRPIIKPEEPPSSPNIDEI